MVLLGRVSAGEAGLLMARKRPTTSNATALPSVTRRQQLLLRDLSVRKS